VVEKWRAAAPLHRLGRELSSYRLEQRGIENGRDRAADPKAFDGSGAVAGALYLINTDHGSIRRECVDHVVALGEAHLRRIL
jgi:hypothetical protein